MALFRSRKQAAQDEEDIGVPHAGGGEDNDSDWFVPRQNGVYQGGPDALRYLRFHPTGKVYLAAAGADLAGGALGPRNPDPTVGQYTGAGRFVVQRTFERPIVFTALSADDAGFTARVTSTGAGETGEYRYDFRVDGAPDDASATDG